MGRRGRMMPRLASSSGACVRARSSRATFSAYSLSFSSARVPNDSGRCSGMPKAESPVSRNGNERQSEGNQERGAHAKIGEHSDSCA